jgi:hypothetical protein
VVVDLNTMDDTGLPWAFLDEAIRPGRLVPGAYVIVGSGKVRAVAHVIDVENDIVHVRPPRLRGIERPSPERPTGLTGG